MGKKAKCQAKIAKKEEKKVNKSLLPPPPPAPEDEIGSRKPILEPAIAGNGFKMLDREGYDDGGVADLALLVDLDDAVLRRKRGETDYFQALKNDLLPRATRGPMSEVGRRDQKVNLAQLLFNENEESEDKGPAEVFMEQRVGDSDPPFKKQREERLAQARAALRLSLLLREPASASLSLSELCKRRLALYGKDGAEDALRCAEKAIEIAGRGLWDGDQIAVEADDNPNIDPLYEPNPTTPGLSHPIALKLVPSRVSQLCLRSAFLQRGNALAALGRNDESRTSYLKILPYIEDEPRCARTDWEAHSLFINIGNTYARSGDFDKANGYYNKAQQLGQDHLTHPNGSTIDGSSMIISAKRARAFALQKVGRIDEAKLLLQQVLDQQQIHNAQIDKQNNTLKHK